MFCHCSWAGLPLDIAYADDVDFGSHSLAFLNQVESITPTCLRHWFLFVNESKTEKTSMTRETNPVAEVWRVTKKLGPLLGDAEDVAHRSSWLCLHSSRCGHCGCDNNMLVKHCAFDFTTPSLCLSSLTTWALGF